LAGPPETKALETRSSVTDAEWRPTLHVGKNGPLPILANVMTVLEHAKEWAGALAFDAFKSRPVFLRDTPEADAKKNDVLEDHNVRWITNWVQRLGIYAGVEVVGQAVHAVAEKSGNHFHPVRDYLSGLRWDGEKRADKWLTTYLGVDDTELSRAFGKC